MYYSPMEGKRGVDVSRLLPFDLFDGLTAEDLAPIAASCGELTVQSGTVMIRQGQVGDDVYLLEEGSVKVFRERGHTLRQIALLEAPTDFGEMAVVNPERIRTATVETASEVRLLTISVIQFRSFLKRLPVLRKNLDKSVKLRSTD